jgi:asparagine synthase (glutamine-hydrolysing)
MGNSSFYQDGTNFLAPECVSADMRKIDCPSYPQPFSGYLANALYRDLTETKLSRVLRMNDRLSMAHGVELRQPFLDWHIVEFAARLSASSKLSDGWGKHVLRKAVENRLPKEIVWAQKRPVVTPQREWMAGPLRDWLRDILAGQGFRECGFFEYKAIMKTLDRYESGRIDNAFPIWQWINTALWFDNFISNGEYQNAKKVNQANCHQTN